LANESDTQYLIQFRRDVQAQFESYFRFFEVQYADGDRQFEVQNHFPYFQNYHGTYVEKYQKSGDPVDRLNVYHQFVLDHRQWYREFVEKWMSVETTNVHFLAYEDLVNNPKLQLGRVVRLMFGRPPIQFWKIPKIINRQNISFKNILKDSDLYKPGFCEHFGLQDIQNLLLQR